MSRAVPLFDLEERTALFGEAVIELCKKIQDNSVNRVVISQLLRSATSIGVNYMERMGLHQKMIFAIKYFLCKKEAQETKHWLRMLSKAEPHWREQLRVLWREAQELTLIFQKITTSLREGT